MLLHFALRFFLFYLVWVYVCVCLHAHMCGYCVVCFLFLQAHTLKGFCTM